ncbi:uncharacterized protein PGTG_13719 [Puccinia graminis f. sp. tritici CRL 75-36-700-3]|uniref:Uncharacterized protein n=1 Tax=Puccinia graminis f. sp. tritici (strain CRL 75-36-700-3 / race SCCL) TaxID=418459 RepID=E3KUG5_PUCGT|nr:uncharacterized protein PGTG_13719 [Puccinia graminis f. sp. tritici CRL 75-36-700-3]EFP87915.2 hypothetical protein PGTG_13719 [Puccinia graminis f. sp. tritici CRL 75-36-700-3]
MTDKTTISHLPLLTKVNFQNWKNVMFLFCLRQRVDAHLLLDLVAGEKDAVAKVALEDKKANAAGILGGNLGLENYAKFITNNNVREPHKMSATEYMSQYLSCTK